MISPILTLSSQLTSCINTEGKLTADVSEVQLNIHKVESLARSLLGCTLHVRGEAFVIRMLEVYYGGLADQSHDWYRTRYVYKKSKFREHTVVQEQEGLKVYINSLDSSDTYARFDLVVGPAGVPVSFLVRSIWDTGFHLVGKLQGSPNTVLRRIGLLSIDHGALIEMNYGHHNAAIILEDTHDRIVQFKNLRIVQQPRIGVDPAFELEWGVNWNFCLSD